jgi:hypothetical protein
MKMEHLVFRPGNDIRKLCRIGDLDYRTDHSEPDGNSKPAGRARPPFPEDRIDSCHPGLGVPRHYISAMITLWLQEKMADDGLVNPCESNRQKDSSADRRRARESPTVQGQ